MRRALLPALALAVLTCDTPLLAEDNAAIEEIRAAWQACSERLDAQTNDWTGWRRNFDGGYADHFEFYDGYGNSVSVLVQTWLIDAIASQKDISCFRADDSLAFIFSEMVSPNMVDGFEGAALSREGRIYYAPGGEIIRVLGQITLEGQVVAGMDNEKYQLARGCGLTQPHLTVADVRLHLDSELGDIEGKRPAFEAETLDWCAMVE